MEDIAPQEIMSRFILDKKGFSSQKRMVKRSAFMPDPYDELSVFRISGWTEEEIWQAGEEYVAKPRKRTLRARGDFGAEHIQNNMLTIKDDSPPPGHAVILGWPETKDERLLIALKLANAARLVLYPNR